VVLEQKKGTDLCSGLFWCVVTLLLLYYSTTLLLLLLSTFAVPSMNTTNNERPI